MVVGVDIPGEILDDFETVIGGGEKAHNAANDMRNVHHQPVQAEISLCCQLEEAESKPAYIHHNPVEHKIVMACTDRGQVDKAVS